MKRVLLRLISTNTFVTDVLERKKERKRESPPIPPPPKAKKSRIILQPSDDDDDNFDQFISQVICWNFYSILSEDA